jgi:hypothetical protein
MEKVDTGWLFNADFEKKLFQDKLHTFESSKLNQEFEFFIHLLEPEKTVYSSKNYTNEYKEFLQLLTGQKLKQTLKPKNIKNWCQDSTDYNTLKKYQDKYETARFALAQKLWTHKTQFISEESQLRENYLYKRPDGLSGIGHLHYPHHKKQILKTIEEFEVILEEEILTRNKDFSTLIEGGEVLSTYENYVDEQYQYKGTYHSSSPVLNKEQQQVHEKNLNHILEYTKAYKGIMSVDGFTFSKGINSICEINARKTMGYTSYKLWKKYFTRKSEFKLLLIKNKNFDYTHKQVCEMFNNDVLLVSPLSNRFLVFIFGSETTKGLNMIEKKLCSTLF